MKFHSVVKRKSVNIPESKTREVTKSGHRFAVGKYTHKGKVYEAWRVLGSGKKKK